MEEDKHRLLDHLLKVYNISEEEFYNNWKWQKDNLIRNPEKLFEVFPYFTEEEKDNIKKVCKKYSMLISPYYLSLIDPFNPNDPIKKQAIPSIEEITLNYGYEDPLREEEHQPIEGLIHRYPDRALILTTNFCMTYCRHCTRKRILGKARCIATYKNWDKILDYIKNSDIREIIISGGDPLTLPISKLEKILEDINKIDKIEVIRIGSRVPVTLPMLLYDEKILNVLSRYSDRLWFMTHFNHPREINEYSKKAIKNITKLGIPVFNQSVLLKGINNDVDVMRELLTRLISIKVKPYYLFYCDETIGTDHFRTDVMEGVEILEKLRGNISGLAIPTYVVDLPKGGGKIHLSPQYILKVKENSVIVKNFEGKIFEITRKREEVLAKYEKKY